MAHDLNDLAWEFMQRYSYIAIDEKTLQNVLKRYQDSNDDKDTILDLARDYILSQDLAEEVVF